MKFGVATLKLFIIMTILTGVIYPLLITLIAKVIAPNTSSGEFISIEGKIVGSPLIAQKFESDKYFWPRPSARDYNPMNSGGSNWGITNLKLKEAVAFRKSKYPGSTNIPSELLYASGSGLDPHISLKAALFQVERVAKSRNLENDQLSQMVQDASHYGFVNVLLLNLALDKEGIDAGRRPD